MCKPPESHRGEGGGELGEGEGEGGGHGYNMLLIHSFHCEGKKMFLKVL